MNESADISQVFGQKNTVDFEGQNKIKYKHTVKDEGDIFVVKKQRCDCQFLLVSKYKYLIYKLFCLWHEICLLADC